MRRQPQEFALGLDEREVARVVGGCPQRDAVVTALFELMDINDNLRDLIINKASASALRSAAQKAGMRTLRDAGHAMPENTGHDQ